MATPSKHDPKEIRKLLEENEQLRARLAEADETLSAIQNGEVDALIVGDQLYTLESAAAASNNFRGTVLDQVHDAVIAVDLESRITYFNAAAERLYGVDAASVLGRPVDRVYRVLWRDAEAEQAAERALRSEGTWRGEYVHEKASGGEVCVDLTVSRLTGPDGETSGLLSVLRDSTLRRAAEAAARTADRRKDEFLATLAHELRNPLAPMRNALEILRISTTGADMELARGMLGRQLDQMVHLVDDLLDISRITLGRVVLRKDLVSLATVIHNAVETSRPVIEASSHHLETRQPAAGLGPLMVEADTTRLSQVLVNLLNNAAKYTPKGGHITLTLDAEPGAAVITVSDDGIGIPPDMLSNVFDLFTQVDGAHLRSQGGLGIGLTLVRRIVEMHGGTVSVHSDGEGKGSAFSVRLPLADQPRERPSKSTGAQEKDGLPPRAAAGCRVLVVDDNRDANESLSALLHLGGHVTASAYDGLEALTAAESFQPDAVLLDIGLPSINGFEVAKRLRAQQWGERLTLIALTGWGNDQDRRQSSEAGINFHLVKPAAIEDLEKLLAPLRRTA